MKHKDTKNQSGKLSTPAADVDGNSGMSSGNEKWDHSSGTSSKSGTGSNKTQERKNVNIETDDGYQEPSKRKFSSSDSESEIDNKGYSSPSRSSTDESFSEDKSDSSERKSSSLDKDEEE